MLVKGGSTSTQETLLLHLFSGLSSLFSCILQHLPPRHLLVLQELCALYNIRKIQIQLRYYDQFVKLARTERTYYLGKSCINFKIDSRNDYDLKSKAQDSNIVSCIRVCTVGHV